MSVAHNYPLVHQLNSVQIQPFHHYPSHDTCVDPDEILPSIFNNDEPHDVLTANPLSYKETKHKLHGDAHTPPLARQIHIRRINIQKTPENDLQIPPQLPQNMTTTVRAQLDTGAEITCTNLCDALHDYGPYDKSFPC